LPINFKGYDPKDIFMCSCNPWKEYTYDMYVKHIMKRHSMKSPKFEMRIKEWISRENKGMNKMIE
jgi:hypothetical protein